MKAIYKDNADTIVGNMDSQIFLGGSEPTTLKDLSEMLGKETIDAFNTSDTRGNSPSYGTTFQKMGHELLSRDELAVLDGGKCILQLRGVRPFISDKYDLTQHPNYKLTSDYTEVEVEIPDIADAENEKHILPADPDVKNFSYTVVDGEVFYRENSVMTQVELKDVRIYDTIEDAEGKPKRVLNKRETMLAQQKQQVIKDAFANWVWQDPQRRIALVKQYNEFRSKFMKRLPPSTS